MYLKRNNINNKNQIHEINLNKKLFTISNPKLVI